MGKEAKTVQVFEYKAEMKQLLDIIVHSLYTHPEVFLRELISNASDALNKIRFRKLTDKEIVDPDVPLEIRIDPDTKEQYFSIEDTGIGMTESDLLTNIGTIAKSGTIEFLEKIKSENKAFDEKLIGQFGVGFYSVFMVADEVVIETRHADKDSKGYRWKSTGQGTYTIEEIDRKQRGTKIYFKLKDSRKEFCEEYRITEVINKYSNFADFPIFVKNKNVNTISALWHKKKTEIKETELNDFYKFIANDFRDPMGHLHLSIEGTVNFKALIFIPDEAPPDLLKFQYEKSLYLYSNKILIQHDCKDLLPEYLRFARGIVDTTDLPLNVSREVVQASPVMVKIRNIITAEILALVKNWATKDTKKYDRFHKHFGRMLKAGISMDQGNKEKIIELIRFESSHTSKGELTSFKDYVSRMRQTQKAIYYLSGDSREAIEKNPNLEYFKKSGLEVLFLSDPMDIFSVPSINEYDKKIIESIDKADIELMPEDKLEKLDDKLSTALISLFKETLRDKIEDVTVSKRLVDSPVTLVTGKGGMDSQVEKMMKLMNKDFQNSKKIMEVNISHPLLRNLSRIYMGDNKSPLLQKCIIQLYESAMLIDGNLSQTADFVKRMTEIMEEATN